MRPLIVLLGASGVGKNTAAELVGKKTGRKIVPSYTTRPKRPGERNGVEHVFISEEDYQKIPRNDIAAKTLFCGYHYCATRQQLRDCGIYIVDRQGLLDVRKNYPDPVLAICLSSSEETRAERMRKRGDSEDNIRKRILNDRAAFAGVEDLCDIVVDADDSTPEKIADEIVQTLESLERKLNQG